VPLKGMKEQAQGKKEQNRNPLSFSLPAFCSLNL